MNCVGGVALYPFAGFCVSKPACTFDECTHDGVGGDSLETKQHQVSRGLVIRDPSETAPGVHHTVWVSVQMTEAQQLRREPRARERSIAYPMDFGKTISVILWATGLAKFLPNHSPRYVIS